MGDLELEYRLRIIRKLAHELGSPMSVIIGIVEMMQVTGQIDEEGLEKIIEKVLDLSKIKDEIQKYVKLKELL